jgi:hypothetical protein
MREHATLRLASGEELAVEIDPDDLHRDEIVVHRTPIAITPADGGDELIAIIDRHLATATPHPAGTTDRQLQADRERPY